MAGEATVQSSAPVLKQMYSDKDKALAKAAASTFRTKKGKKAKKSPAVAAKHEGGY
jgi:hypothetical protein